MTIEQNRGFRASAWFFIFCTAILLWLLILMAKSFALSLIVGGMMSLLMTPYFNYLSGRFSRPFSAGVATLTLLLVVIVPTLLLVFVALHDASSLIRAISGTESQDQLGEWWRHWRWAVEGAAQTYIPGALDFDFEGHVVAALKIMLDWISNTVLRVAAEAPALILQLVMGVLSCFFFLLDGSRLSSWGKGILPLSESKRQVIASSFRDATRVTLLASLAAALAQSAVVVLTFVILGIPAVALAAGTTFIFAWIPVLGSFPIFVCAGIWAAANGVWWKVTVIVLAAVFTGLIDNFIRPLVLKGGSDMHPLVSLVAILGGIELFGIIGVLLGPVIASMFLACAKIWPHMASELGWE
jgi:predicted PurR-regulated permease PerM